MNNIINDFNKKISLHLDFFNKKILNININKIPIELFNNIYIKDNNKNLLINKISNIYLEDYNKLVIEVIESKYLKKIYNEILNIDIEFNISTIDNKILIKVPINTIERRNKLIKLLKDKLENEKINIRNTRRDFNNKIKKLLKDKFISKDEFKINYNKIIDLTNKYILELENIVRLKENEILKI
ncbi:ribosome-recycling factor [endosymbiont of Sipalinus gigas]|uniref:ribosome recycling factor n=1 Tax=endosymbiont of Sipalinus gigas TaxID=1972134 RepID=UPI000DC6E5A3|nr:ribosome recycling factor [endosymbiont of Sipalinus gigas]BBA85296.1 ribosome-recycling factor [endosymbiont of Sipalinus gigas]